ncbi:MAG: hypothetical protein WCL04_03530 [Verrucomicrobiota bacterium]
MAGGLQAQRARWLPKPAARLELRFSAAPLPAKLDAIAAVIVALREAHAEELTPKQWENLGRAQALLADVMMEPKAARAALEGGR